MNEPASTDLFPEIGRRVDLARRFDRWRARLPWRALPGRLRPHAFRLYCAVRRWTREVSRG